MSARAGHPGHQGLLNACPAAVRRRAPGTESPARPVSHNALRTWTPRSARPLTWPFAGQRSQQAAYGGLLAAAYLGTVPAANLLTAHVGTVPVGLGMMAPAGVYLGGLALVLRDLTREVLGPHAVLAAVAAGGAVSWLLAEPRLALASVAAFVLSELLDTAVYEPLRRLSLMVAVAVSNTVGAVADSVIFLSLAFGSLAFLPGQLLGKTLMTLAALTVIAVVRRRRRTVTA
ncbi:VUT family protein [Streptomyces caeruleatus]|uniref:VUT family protein n=1 Tax=Streptomyces caeruleatus TaxID=661399 RepID=UPI001FCA0788|nr:VUT family protein [Streptomyces caeruleatus]